MTKRLNAEGRTVRRALAAAVWIAAVLLVMAAAPQGEGFSAARVAASEQPQPEATTPAPAGLVTSGALGAIVGAAIVWAATRRRSNRRVAPVPASDRDHVVPPEPSAPTGEPSKLVDELVQGLIASHDLATNDAQRARIRESLRRAGVTAIEPKPLTPFDPEQHQALAVESGGDPQSAGRIARVERVGWVRGHDVLRSPEVSVYPQSLPDPPA
jgi:hypothetical protein